MLNISNVEIIEELNENQSMIKNRISFQDDVRKLNKIKYVCCWYIAKQKSLS